MTGAVPSATVFAGVCAAGEAGVLAPAVVGTAGVSGVLAAVSAAGVPLSTLGRMMIGMCVGIPKASTSAAFLSEIGSAAASCGSQALSAHGSGSPK